MVQDPLLRRFDALAAGRIADRIGGCSDRSGRGNMGRELRVAVHFGMGSGFGRISGSCERLFRFDHCDLACGHWIIDFGSFSHALGPVVESEILS